MLDFVVDVRELTAHLNFASKPLEVLVCADSIFVLELNKAMRRAVKLGWLVLNVRDNGQTSAKATESLLHESDRSGAIILNIGGDSRASEVLEDAKHAVEVHKLCGSFTRDKVLLPFDPKSARIFGAPLY